MGRAHIVLPDELIEEIDEMVGKRKRSEYIADLIERDLRQKRKLELFNQMAGALKDVDVPGWETSESIVEWVRAQRRMGTDHWKEYENRERACAVDRSE